MIRDKKPSASKLSLVTSPIFYFEFSSLGCILFIKFSRIVGKLELVRARLRVKEFQENEFFTWWKRSFKQTSRKKRAFLRIVQCWRELAHILMEFFSGCSPPGGLPSIRDGVAGRNFTRSCFVGLDWDVFILKETNSITHYLLSFFLALKGTSKAPTLELCGWAPKHETKSHFWPLKYDKHPCPVYMWVSLRGFPFCSTFRLNNRSVFRRFNLPSGIIALKDKRNPFLSWFSSV